MTLRIRRRAPFHAVRGVLGAVVLAAGACGGSSPSAAVVAPSDDLPSSVSIDIDSDAVYVDVSTTRPAPDLRWISGPWEGGTYDRVLPHWIYVESARTHRRARFLPRSDETGFRWTREASSASPR